MSDHKEVRIVAAKKDEPRSSEPHQIDLLFYYENGAMAFSEPGGSEDFIYLYPSQIKQAMREMRKWQKELKECKLNRNAQSVNQP